MSGVAPVTILTSGVGLGVYLPSLLIERKLRQLGVAAEVEVLERYYTPARQAGHLAIKAAHHQDFALAQLAHRMARDVQTSLDTGVIDALLQQWRAEGRERFVVWSGFWLPVLERYQTVSGRADLALDFCRIDAEVSASFRVHRASSLRGREIWLWSAERKRTEFELPVTGEAPLAFAARDERLVVHGGGWGIGTYREAAVALSAAGFACDVVVHHESEALELSAHDRAYRIDPAWHPWHRNASGRHTFPPLGRVGQSAPVAEGHVLYEHLRRARAIVSKPGGGTLIDSLSAATPVVLLPAYGYAERANGELWEHLGYGISWEAWRETGFSTAVLERLHHALATRPQRGPDYVLELAQGGQVERAVHA